MNRILHFFEDHVPYTTRQAFAGWLLNFGVSMLLLAAAFGYDGIVQATFANTHGSIFGDYINLFWGFLLLVVGAAIVVVSELLQPTRRFIRLPPITRGVGYEAR